MEAEPIPLCSSRIVKIVNINRSRGFAGEGASNESGVVEDGDFRFIPNDLCGTMLAVQTSQIAFEATSVQRPFLL